MVRTLPTKQDLSDTQHQGVYVDVGARDVWRPQLGTERICRPGQTTVAVCDKCPINDWSSCFGALERPVQWRIQNEMKGGAEIEGVKCGAQSAL